MGKNPEIERKYFEVSVSNVLFEHKENSLDTGGLCIGPAKHQWQLLHIQVQVDCTK